MSPTTLLATLLALSSLAYFLGRLLTGKIEVLDRFRIPEAVTGGIVVAIVVALLRSWAEITVSFTMGELALLTFFTTIGLNARLGDLRAGGTILVLTLLMCAVSVIVQNLIGLGSPRISVDAHMGK